MAAYTSTPASAAVALTIAAEQAPEDDTEAVLPLAAPSDGTAWHLGSVRWSYDGEPADGTLTIAWGANSEVYHVTAGGPGFLPFAPPIRFPANTAVTITLAAAGVTGTVYGSVWRE